MKLTKYEHACVLVDDGAARVLIDPGTYSHGFEDVTGLSAVLVTHQHADHVDVDRLRPLLERNNDATLYADSGTAVVLAEADIAVTAVRPGDRLDVGIGIDVRGGYHAVIHPDLPIVPNVGYLVGGRFFHPGDSFTIPDEPVEILGLPTGAPWLKASEAVDYLRAVAPRVAIPIHEATLANPARTYELFGQLAPPGTAVGVVGSGDTVEL